MALWCLLLVWLVGSKSLAAPAPVCREPGNELKAQWLDHHTKLYPRGFHESHFSVESHEPRLRHRAYSDSKNKTEEHGRVADAQENEMQMKLEMEAQFLSEVIADVVSGCNSTEKSSRVHRRSLCPWYHVLTYDPNRYPQQMVEARSDCQQPLEGTTCEAVTYYVPVLRKSGLCNDDGFYVYDRSWHKLQVGYTLTQVLTVS